MNNATTQTAGDIKVGDVVQFSATQFGKSVMVRVTSIEPCYAEGEDERPADRAKYGECLMFRCVVADALETAMPVRTTYFRRERSAISGRGVVS